jgi:hypothetical protein
MTLVLGLMGCAAFEAKEVTYLRSAENRATQEEVTQRLGPPVLTKTGSAGEPILVYQVRTQQPGGRYNAPGLWCDEYVLMFDGQGILRQWTHRSYFHGGEFQPTFCVPGGADAKP